MRVSGNLELDGTSLKFEQGGDHTEIVSNSPGSDITLTLPNDADMNLLGASHGGDTTKEIKFTVSGATTAKALTITSSHTDDRTLTLPDATDTLVGKATTDTLTNKTLTSPTITVLDNAFTIQDEGDTTKDLVFSLGGATTAKTITITSSHTDDRTLTLPDATDTLVGKATTDTLINKTLTAPVISTISNTGTLTLPTSTDTLIGKATTDTLTNKTATALDVTGGSHVRFLTQAAARFYDDDDSNYVAVTAPTGASTWTLTLPLLPPTSSSMSLVSTDSSGGTAWGTALSDVMADGTIFIGVGTSATAITPSGDVTISNAGVTAIASGVIVNADINSAAAIANSKLSLASIPTNTLTIADNGDITKLLAFDCSGISTGTTRTWTIPDENGTVVGTAASQTLTNKKFGDTTIFNDSGDATADVRMESNTNPGMFFMDAGAEAVLIGSTDADPSDLGLASLHVSLNESADPTSWVGGGLTGLNANTAILAHQADAAAHDCFVSIVSGASGTAGLYLGGRDQASEAGIRYNASTNSLTLRAFEVDFISTSSNTDLTLNAASAPCTTRIRTQGLAGTFIVDDGTDSVIVGSTDTSGWTPLARFHVIDGQAEDSITSLSADSVILAQADASAGTNCALSVISGTAGSSILYLGPSDNGVESRVLYDAGSGILHLGANNSGSLLQIATTGSDFTNAGISDDGLTITSTHASFNGNTLKVNADRVLSAGYDLIRCTVDADGTPDNVHRFDGSGAAYGEAGYTGTGADYAEYFEWKDGNNGNKDRVGELVALDGDYIKIAEAGDQVIGVVSATPAVVGNHPLVWSGKYEKDAWGRKKKNNAGNPIKSPQYDHKKKYKERKDRREWSTVGLIGRLRVKNSSAAAIPSNWIKLKDINQDISEYLVK